MEETFLPARYIIQLANSPAMDRIFACIYFLEDASLTVVGKNDKNLSMETEFAEKALVSMKWGKHNYHGSIIKIHGK